MGHQAHGATQLSVSANSIQPEPHVTSLNQNFTPTPHSPHLTNTGLQVRHDGKKVKDCNIPGVLNGMAGAEQEVDGG